MHGIELHQLRPLRGVKLQNRARPEDGVTDPRAGGEALRQAAFIQKSGGKADVFPRLPDEILARGVRELQE